MIRLSFNKLRIYAISQHVSETKHLYVLHVYIYVEILYVKKQMYTHSYIITN